MKISLLFFALHFYKRTKDKKKCELKGKGRGSSGQKASPDRAKNCLILIYHPFNIL